MTLVLDPRHVAQSVKPGMMFAILQGITLNGLYVSAGASAQHVCQSAGHPQSVSAVIATDGACLGEDWWYRTREGQECLVRIADQTVSFVGVLER